MSVLVVSYELKSKTKDYDPFYKALMETADGWCHYIDNLWIVNTHLTANDFAKKLYPHMVDTDHLFVGKLTGEYQGWLPKEGWEWIGERDF